MPTVVGSPAARRSTPNSSVRVSVITIHSPQMNSPSELDAEDAKPCEPAEEEISQMRAASLTGESI